MCFHRRTVVALTCALVVIASVACRPPSALGQSGACLTAEPMRSGFLGSVRFIYEDPKIDSIKWKAAGFPFARGAAITIVTTNNTCKSAVAAFNKQSGRTGTPQAVTQVYVAKIGSTGYVVMTPQEGTNGEWQTHYWFNTKWVFKQEMGG